ncbi:MAG TPA: tetratricopeptide repeat protein, partial [Planctomycetaceae bacterium]|nr:tetratricopeptide repeat protein [Planctomycetaceae bacterium]
CRRTGRGDLDASRKLVAPRLDALKDVKGAGARLQYGIYRESEGRKAEALKAYSDVFAGTHYPFAGMLAFLVADEHEQTEKRDELLTEIICQSGAFAEHYLPFALAFRKTLSNHDEEFITRARADWYVSQRMNSGDTTIATYFVGKFLLNRGRRELAIEYLRQAASSPVEVSYGDVRILAGVALSTVDVETPPLRAVEFPEAMSTGIDDVVQAVGPQRDDERTQLLESARTQAPELTIAWIQSAVAAAAQKKFDESDAFYRRALELVDGEPTLLAFQGKLHAAHKRRREAIADYEAVLKQEPKHPVALLQLAVILAISNDDEVRNGKRSLELAERCMQCGLIAKWSAYEVLAVAHAEAGQFAEAIKDCNQALEHAPDARKPAIQYYINEFKQNRPLREQPPEEEPE